jgi:hypothetical protein
MKHVDAPKELLDTQNYLGLKAFWKPTWRLSQKKTSWRQKLKRGKKTWSK